MSRVGKQKPVGRSGIFFSFPNFTLHKLECTGGGGVKKKKKVENRKKKKFQLALLSPPGHWTGNYLLFEDGLRSLYIYRILTIGELSNFPTVQSHYINYIVDQMRSVNYIISIQYLCTTHQWYLVTFTIMNVFMTSYST